MGELIAVLSGKGGTGKTSVCAGIATALSQMGNKVLCVDCDIGLRNLDIALGISELGAISFLDVCRGDYDVSMASHHPVYPNLQFLTAPMNCPAGDIDPLEFARMLNKARKKFNYILLDAPAGIEAGFRLAAKAADRIILVTGPDPASIRDARQAAQVLEQMGKKNIRLIVNRISKKMAAALNLTVDDIMDEAGLPLLGLVPEDEQVVLAAAFHQPLLGYGKKGAAAACRRIAKRIEGHFVPVLKVIK
ncbi:MAG: P-loop NTPase [Oscillospiraceae bacterium]|nr:P-loop NTPase [Oscillospiraceae bacterium]